MLEEIFNINSFNIVSDDEFYYFFRALNNRYNNDIEKGLLKVFIEEYRYHQNGRPDIFANISDEQLKNDLIENFERLSTIVITEDDNIVEYLSYKIKKKTHKKTRIIYK